MPIYFDHKCQVPYPGQHTDLQWHKTAPLLAAASFSEASSGSVIIYQDEGEPLQESLTRKTHSATAIQWHPKKMILAMGWETGEITIRNEQDGETHNGPIDP
ncbi:hypothetical protein LSH36_179g04002 [Paralvinella palmiformis]|uniref:IFT140 first beta-propeller domain-containing protein n=1 Tax=Paralvinella palmiformis TaxID=53620 RepID=A0AAD9JRQ1_9ANNE|nr:hypothetical protein LSH36_179g04002 [Paralvinella palmiformis]